MADALKLFLPLDTAAVSLGADQIARALEAAAEKRGVALSLTRTGSRGMHWLEPLLEIDHDGARYGFGPVDTADIDTLFDAILEARAKGGAPQHDKAIGPVEAVPFFAGQDRLIFARCGVIDPVSLTDFEAHDGGAGLKRAIEMGPKAVCEEIYASGLRGRGGAGFPAGIKWRTVAGAEAEQKYIVVNADEGDSGTFADRMIMEGDPMLLLEGMAIAGFAVGATKGYIYLRSEYPIAARVLEAAIADARKGGLLGENIYGSGVAFDVEVFIGAGAYICGEETSLLNSLEGKRGEVRAKPPLPALEGLFGQPTLVHNVISLCSTPAIITGGADAYRQFGMGRSTGSMPFQLAGDIKHSGLFEAGFGLTLRELIEDIGGGSHSGRPLRAIQIGGPLGAYLPPSLWDLPIDYEALAAEGAGVGHGGVVAYNDTVDLLEQARYAFEFCAEESCGKCTPCRIGAVRGVEVIDKIRSGDDPAANLQLVDDLCEVMVDGSLCAMGGMTPIPVQSAMKHFPEDFNGTNAAAGKAKTNAHS